MRIFFIAISNLDGACCICRGVHAHTGKRISANKIAVFSNKKDLEQAIPLVYILRQLKMNSRGICRFNRITAKSGNEERCKLRNYGWGQELLFPGRKSLLNKLGIVRNRRVMLRAIYGAFGGMGKQGPETIICFVYRGFGHQHL